MSFPPAIEAAPGSSVAAVSDAAPPGQPNTKPLDSPPVSDTLLSVHHPARNEAETIASVVSSILGSTYEPFELIVVDDRSTDGTASIVQGLTADKRLRLIRGDQLPEGWYGKPWACLQGYRHATGELLLFTDADTRHEPELLRRAVGLCVPSGPTWSPCRQPSAA